MESLHPVHLLSGLDGDVVTALHSLFVLQINPTTNSMDVLCRHPSSRKNIEVVEDGLRGFLVDYCSQVSMESVSSADFVLTNHDGRIYIHVSISKLQVIALACALPNFEYCRSLLYALSEESADVVCPLVYALTDTPLLPLPNLTYEFQFSQSTSSISFNELTISSDEESAMIVLNLFTPEMMVYAWEALIVERRILVISSYSSMLLPCCEFLRKIIAPLPYTGTYIPELPVSSMEAIDAPGTYIIGVETSAVQAAGLNLYGIVVLDLDRRKVVFTPAAEDDPYLSAPSAVLNHLIAQITACIDRPLATWRSRSCLSSPISAVSHTNRSTRQVESNKAKKQILDSIQKIFISTNQGILSAQFCRITAFFRDAYCSTSTSSSASSGAACFGNGHSVPKYYRILGVIPKAESLQALPIGFSEQYGSKVGCMQLWKGNIEEIALLDAIHHTVPCWVELNSWSLSIYEQADDLPLIFASTTEFAAVETCPLEPEGHVFQITLNDTTVFRFTASDQESRQRWINAIEEQISLCLSGNVAGSSASSKASLSAMERLQYQPKDPSYNSTLIENTIDTDSKTIFNSRSLGITGSAEYIHSTNALHYNDFRFHVQNTQMVLSLMYSMECASFEYILQHTAGFERSEKSLLSFLSSVSPTAAVGEAGDAGDNNSYDSKMSRYTTANQTYFRCLELLDQMEVDCKEQRHLSIGSMNYLSNGYGYSGSGKQSSNGGGGGVSSSDTKMASPFITRVASAVTPAVTPSKPSFLRRIFSSSSTSTSNTPIGGSSKKNILSGKEQSFMFDAEDTDEGGSKDQEYQKKRQMEMLVERVKEIKMIYNRCLEDLSFVMVEVSPLLSAVLHCTELS